MPDRRLHHRPLIAVVAAVASLAAGAAAARADVAQVTVFSPGGAQQTLALEALAGSEDVVGRAYVVRDGDGEETQTVTGFSLAALLEAAGADPYGFSYLEAQRPGGGAVLLSRHQALDPGAFADGPPVVYATATGTGFLRPSSGPEDANAGDSFEAPQGIAIVLRKGSQLRVRAKASPLRTEPGMPVEFEAIVERAGSGESLGYSWYFDDGGSASGATPRHRFAKPGSYDVVVGVTTSGNETGASDVVTVQVGPAPKGPDRKGGGRNGSADAPDHGAVDGPALGGSGGGSMSSADAPATQPAPEPKAEVEPAAQAATPSGERVVGELVSASTGAAAKRPAPQAAARRGRLRADSTGDDGVPAAALGVLAALGLLGAGALVEARQLGPALLERAPWRRRAA